MLTPNTWVKMAHFKFKKKKIRSLLHLYFPIPPRLSVSASVSQIQEKMQNNGNHIN